MPRLVGRSRLNIEELECRAQPALFGLLVSVQAGAGLENAFGFTTASHAPAFTSVNFTLPTHANAHAQTEIIIHFGTGSTPPADSGGSGSGNSNSGTTGGSGSNSSNSGSAATPGTSSPVALAVFSPSTSATAFSSVLARESASIQSSVTAAQQAVAMPAATVASANLGIQLPPGRTADATTVLPSAVNAILPPDAQAVQAVSQGSRQFPGAESIPYLGSEGTNALALFNGADAPVAAVSTATVRPVTTTAMKTSLRLDRELNDTPVNLLAQPAPAQAAVEEEDPGATDTVPMALPVADEGPTSPWVWASVLGGAAVGTAWVVWQYWLKPPALRPEEFVRRNYLLGLDFNRL